MTTNAMTTANKAPVREACVNLPTVSEKLVRHENGVERNGTPTDGAPTNEITASASTTNGTPTTTVWTVIQIPVAQIGPNPFQPRLTFEAEEMDDLIASVKSHGVLQPVTVRTAAVPIHPTNGQSREGRNRKGNEPLYHLIAGERRLRASRAAGRKTIPAIVRDDLSDMQAAELAVVENVQRANLSVIEEARAYKRLMIEFRMKEERIAKKVGKSVQVVRDTLKLLALPESVQQMLAKRKLSASHGQLLLKLAPHEEICNLVATHVEGSGMTATALSQNLLPNARQLRDKKLVTELDYRTKFDWKNVCGQCPHKAYFTAGYASYCAKPQEWGRKQTEAIELQKLEAARVLEEARSREGAVDIAVLASGSYRDLTYAQIPAGCSEGCPCRSSTCLPHDPTRTRPVCLNPERYDELLKAQRQAIAEERQRRYLGFYVEAKAVIAPEAIEMAADASGSNSSDAAVPETSVATEPTGIALSLLVYTIICGDHLNYRGREKWDQLCREVAEESELELPWERWQNEQVPVSEVLTVLRGVEAGGLVRFTANLLLAQEALQAIQYGGETPLLSAVLGHEEAAQTELETDEEEEYGEEEYEEEDSEAACNGMVAPMSGIDDVESVGAGLDGMELHDMELDGTDFEGAEFEDERFHAYETHAQGIDDNEKHDGEARSFEDEPYQQLAA